MHRVYHVMSNRFPLECNFVTEIDIETIYF